MTYKLITSPLYRTGIGYSAMVAVAAGLVASSISVHATSLTFPNNLDFPSFYIFYGIYTAFAFIPGFLALLRLEQKIDHNKIGKTVIYFGLLWSAVTVVTSLAATVLSGLLVADGGSCNSVSRYVFLLSDCLAFLHPMPLGLIAVLIALNCAYLNQLPQGSPRYSFIVYYHLNITSWIAFPTTLFKPRHDNVHNIDSILSYATLFFLDITTILAVLVVFNYGHLWALRTEIATAVVDSSKLEQSDHK